MAGIGGFYGPPARPCGGFGAPLPARARRLGRSQRLGFELDLGGGWAHAAAGCYQHFLESGKGVDGSAGLQEILLIVTPSICINVAVSVLALFSSA